ncbi:RcnB family protein [Caulobacter hibisci]|uniref:RcnB family protein n=1 Tax=Caulobacter hibisci TaxID=2035993 RepID=A0ABS0T4P8_9CAUL|nr:RcnB family protein [Caulobacter hibisci]MBI1685873.1 RcnB family protein [Caulobacter hibisci]
MKRLIITAVAASLLAGTALSGTAMAQPRHDDRQEQRAYNEGRRDQARQERRDDRRDDRRAERREDRRWAKGQRLDSRYRADSYYVKDYRRHGLRQPPRGYRWQRVNDQYVLAAVATGLIASVIIASH